MDPHKLTADIQAYSTLVQAAIGLGKLTIDGIRPFIEWFRNRNNEPIDNAELDAITEGVLAGDIVRKALADAEAAGPQN